MIGLIAPFQLGQAFKDFGVGEGRGKVARVESGDIRNDKSESERVSIGGRPNEIGTHGLDTWRDYACEAVDSSRWSLVI